MRDCLLRLTILLCGAAWIQCSGSTPGTATDGGADLGLAADRGPKLDLAGDGADAGAADSAPPLPIFGLSISDNPHNVLAFHVAWSTDEPATSMVEFGRGTSPEFRIRKRVLTRRHRVLVIGLHADTAYRFSAASRGASGALYRSAVHVYRTRSLPANIPTGTVTIHDRRRAYNGWTLMAVAAATRDAYGARKDFDKDYPPSLVMYDMGGSPVWYRTHGLAIPGDASLNGELVLTHGPFSLVDNNHYSAVEYDLAGELVWTGPMQGATAPERFHHSFTKLPDGNYLGLTRTLKNYVLGDNVVELDRNHKQVWTWSIFDHLTPPAAGSPSGTYDWSHFNSMVMDKKKKQVHVMSRNLDVVFKIDMTSGKILWRLGQRGDFSIDTKTYPWFFKAHAVEVQPNGNILLYDNGTRARGFSRAIEYAVDTSTRKARIVWQYGGPGKDSWATYYWGDADRLENGNTLITAGTWDAGTQSKVFEVTHDKQRVWEMVLPVRPSTKSLIGMYNSQRVIPPLVEQINARR
jgi:hypothetical protein